MQCDVYRMHCKAVLRQCELRHSARCPSAVLSPLPRDVADTRGAPRAQPAAGARRRPTAVRCHAQRQPLHGVPHAERLREPGARCVACCGLAGGRGVSPRGCAKPVLARGLRHPERGQQRRGAGCHPDRKGYGHQDHQCGEGQVSAVGWEKGKEAPGTV